MARSKKSRYLSEEEIELLGVPPITKKLPVNPIAADEQILLHRHNLALLDDWVVDEIVARSAERIREHLKEFQKTAESRMNPDVSFLTNLISEANPKRPLKSYGRSASYVEWSKRRHTVASVLAAQKIMEQVKKKARKGEEPKSDDAFELAGRYLASIGAPMALETLKKNFYTWRGGATPHPSLLNFWIGELAPFAVKARQDTETL